MTTLEQLVDLLAKTSPYELMAHYPQFVEGLANAKFRLQNIEKSRIADMNRMQKIEELTTDERIVLDSLVRDRDDLQKRLAALEQQRDPPTQVPAITVDMSSGSQNYPGKGLPKA